MIETLRCPRCGTAMMSARSRTALMYGCAACGGIWLDNADSRRVVTALCDDTLSKADLLARHAKREVDLDAPVACPVCRRPLARWQVDHAELAVDQCPKHGAWFDRNELSAIARTLAARDAYVTGSAAHAIDEPLSAADREFFNDVSGILSNVD